MSQISFEELPKAVALLGDRLAGIEQLLREQRHTPQQPESDQVLTIQQAGALLSLAVPTLYGLVHRKKIPVSKQGKRLYFSKQRLIDWIQYGKKPTQIEIDSEADLHLMKIKKRGN